MKSLLAIQRVLLFSSASCAKLTLSLQIQTLDSKQDPDKQTERVLNAEINRNHH